MTVIFSGLRSPTHTRTHNEVVAINTKQTRQTASKAPPRLEEDLPSNLRAKPRTGLSRKRRFDGVGMRLVDINRVFDTASTPPVIINSFDINTLQDKEALDSLIYTYYEGDSLNVVPHCECRKTRGAAKIDSRCSYCGTIIRPVSEQPLESLLWIAPPDGVATFINPQAWTMLSKALTHGGLNGLMWLCDPRMPVGPEPHREIRRLMDLGIERGINHFYEHFDRIIDMLFNAGVISGTTRRQKDDLYQFIKLNRERIFCKHLPIPSRLEFVTEKSITGSFADTTMKSAIDAIRTISATVHSQTPLDLRLRQSRAMKANESLATYHQEHMATLASKRGWLRKHVFGSPLYFTFRAVISSLSERHEKDELHLPWGVAVSTYQMHLVSKMFRMINPDTGRTFTPNECLKHIHEHTLRYSPLLDQLFQELIAESPHKGLPVLFNRNPSLDRGSIQEFFVTKINPDPRVNAVAMSVLTLKAPNRLHTFKDPCGHSARRRAPCQNPKTSLRMWCSHRSNPKPIRAFSKYPTYPITSYRRKVMSGTSAKMI